MSFRPFSSADLPTVRRVCAGFAALAVLVLAWPALAWPTLAAAVAGAIWTARRFARPDPAPKPAVMLLGHDAANGEEILADSDLARQHMLVVGGDDVRAGYFADLLRNAAEPGAGGILVSSDPDRTLYRRVLGVCVAAGRADDLLVLDFTRPGAGSHTFNPFASGRSDALVQLVSSLARGSIDRGAEGAMWMGRAVAMLTALMSALVWKRDEGLLVLTARAVADHTDLEALIDLHATPEMPVLVAKTLRAYLSSLPGYDPDRGHHQRQTTIEQHERLRRHLLDALDRIDAYPHVFSAASPDVIMDDVIGRRRILLVVLPDADDPAQEMLGKMILSSLRNVAGSTLGSTLDADWSTAVDLRPFVGPRPFFVLANDVDRYAIEGLAILAAQGRSLNIALTFGVSSIPDMLERADREGKSILANTATKLFLRVPHDAAVRAGSDESMDLRDLDPEEGFLTRRLECRRVRLDGFPRPAPTAGARFNRLVALDPPAAPPPPNAVVPEGAAR